MATTANSLELRLDRLRRAGARVASTRLLITSDESIAYLTGFRPIQMERFFGVVVAPERSAVIVPALDRGQIEEAPSRLTRISYGAESDGMPELADALAGARTVGVEEDHLIYARARALARAGLRARAGRVGRDGTADREGRGRDRADPSRGASSWRRDFGGRSSG